LQALALLNDPQLIEAARFVGARMLREGGASAADQVRFVFRLVTSRSPSEREVATLVAALQEQEAIFGAEPDSVAAFLNTGEGGADLTLPRERLAAATMLASLLFNHDEAVMRR